ncbi:hypothetical protein ES703_116011 [subsurface metagenome]
MNGTQPSLDSWQDFKGNYLKVEHIKTWPAIVVVTTVDGYFDDKGKARIVFDVEYLARKFKWEANQTNIQIIEKSGITSPKGVIGKKLFFKQVENFNPQLRKKVPSLEIEKIE